MANLNINFLIHIVIGISIFFLFYFIAIVIKSITLRLANKVNQQKKVIINLLANITKVAIILLGLITGLGSIGIDVSALVASLGLTGFAVSFALKDTLANTLSGILVILYQPFQINDYIKISNISGQVITIDLRYTTLIHGNTKILVPNSTLLTKEVIVSQNPIPTN